MESTPEGSEEKESGSATESKELMLEGDEGKKYGTVSDLPIEEKAAEEQHCQRKKLCDLPHLVEPAFFFYMLAIWSYLPLNEQYVYMRLEADTPPHRSVTHEESKCFGNHTPAEQARDDYIKVTLSNYTLLYNIFETLPAIVVSLVLCSWGDKHGRKLGLIFPCIGGVIKGILYILADIYGWSIDFLILPNAIEGFSGSHMTIAGSAYAYVADVVPPSKITFRFAVLNALLFAGSSVGNVAIGYMIRGLGFLTSFFIMTIWYAIALIYIIFFVPESIIEKPEDRPISICASIKELWEATAAAFKVYVIQRPDKGAKWRLILMLIASTLHAILVLGQVELDTLYLIGPPFCFNPIEVGYFLAFLCATSVIGPVAGTKLFEKLGLADATMGIIASISGAGAFLLQAFATSREAIFLVPVVNWYSASITALSRAIMSKDVTEGEQGAVQASVSSMNTFGDFLSVTLLIGMFSLTATKFYGATFIVIALLCILCLAFFVMVATCLRPERSDADRGAAEKAYDDN